MGLLLISTGAFAKDIPKNSIRTNLLSDAIGLPSIEYERALSEKGAISIDYWLLDLGIDEDDSYFDNSLNNIRVMYRYYSTQALAGGFVGIGGSRMSYDLGSGYDKQTYYGLDFKAGYTIDVVKHVNVGFQAGFTRYFGESGTDTNDAGVTRAYESPGFIPNMGVTLAIRI